VKITSVLFLFLLPFGRPRPRFSWGFISGLGETIVYNSVSGQLFYNQNGSAAGFGSGGLFATLTGAPILTASDFILQA
jgi:hypothetical protein